MKKKIEPVSLAKTTQAIKRKGNCPNVTTQAIFILFAYTMRTCTFNFNIIMTQKNPKNHAPNMSKPHPISQAWLLMKRSIHI